MKTKKNNIRGIVGTIAFHALLVLCFLFFGFHSPLPPPADEGVEINLGYGDFGGTGDIQTETPNTQPAAGTTVPESADDKVVTQNTEDAASLNKNKNTTNKPVNPEDNINKNALYPGKKSNGGGSYGKSGGPGDGPGKTPGDGGGPGNGISYDLKNRTFKSLEKPVYNSREVGTVVVTIWVDKQGNVTKATAGTRGTTATDKVLWRAAETAALKSKCHIKSDAPEQQTGTITYIFMTN